jgi:hypothetical protein
VLKLFGIGIFSLNNIYPISASSYVLQSISKFGKQALPLAARHCLAALAGNLIGRATPFEEI